MAITSVRVIPMCERLRVRDCLERVGEDGAREAERRGSVPWCRGAVGRAFLVPVQYLSDAALGEGLGGPVTVCFSLGGPGMEYSYGLESTSREIP
jgi:hypothetical protein